MKSSFCIDLQRFMLIPTKFSLSPFFDKKFTNVLSNRLKCITKYVYYGNITYIL